MTILIIWPRLWYALTTGGMQLRPVLAALYECGMAYVVEIGAMLQDFERQKQPLTKTQEQLSWTAN